MTFEDAYRTHRAGLLRYARRWCSNDGALDPEDVAQETFLTAMGLWAKRSGDNVFAWLVGIGRRVYWHLYRDKGRTKRGGRATTVEWNPETDHRAVPATQEVALYVAQLREKFGCLGPAQASAMEAVAEGFSGAEIAEMRGTTQQAAALSISTGRKRLREMLGVDAHLFAA